MELNGFKDDESFGLLDVEKKVDERRPWAFRFEGSEDRLVIRSGIAGANGGVFDQDIVLARDFLYLVEEGGRFDRTLQSRLVLLEPLIQRWLAALERCEQVIGPQGLRPDEQTPPLSRGCWAP